MAGASTKKRIETNRGIVSRHRTVIAGSAAFCFLCLVFNLGSFKHQSTALALFGLVTSLGAEVAAFWCEPLRLLALREATREGHTSSPATTPFFSPACRLIHVAARPGYDEKGEVVHAGADLSVGGVSEHCFDVIYTVSFVHVAVVFWRYFWLLLLAIPAYALFRLMRDVVIPWCASASLSHAPIQLGCRAGERG